MTRIQQIDKEIKNLVRKMAALLAEREEYKRVAKTRAMRARTKAAG